MVQKVISFFKRLFNPKSDFHVSISPKVKYDDGLKPNGFSFNITKKF